MPSGTVRALPFSAVRGMEDAKKALLCVATDDGISGVLIKGPKGTAKSVIARSFAELLPDREMVCVPPNITDEQLFGGLDVEDAIRSGRRAVKGGCLQKADGNMLFLDNVNLFDPGTLSSILDCVGSGKVIVEREGVSSEYPLRTTVIATMDPAEQPLRDGLADRFDICVQSYTVTDRAERETLISSNLDFDDDPAGFMERCSADDDRTVAGIERARRIIGDVVITIPDIEKISKICSDLDVKGHRADISVARVSKALAALDGRTAVSDGDIEEAAVMCLLHRRGAVKRDVDDEDDAGTEERTEETDVNKEVEQPPDMEAAAFPDLPETCTEQTPDMFAGGAADETDTVADIISSVRERLETIDGIEAVRLHSIAGAGRRKNVAVKGRRGRYRGSRIPKGRSEDPAFDATVRAAAPYQRARPDKGLSINIESQDIRDKIRIRKDSCSFLFAVDVSGSLVDTGMMYDIKEGVRAMLADGYVRRDKVALMTFRSGDVRISVPFTRSVNEIERALDRTEAGGGTPLGAALLLIREYLLNYIRKNPEERCFVILMTDGDATDPVIRGDALRELKKITTVMRIPRTEWVVVDSSLRVGRVNYALRLANMLDARYIRLEDLRSA